MNCQDIQKFAFTYLDCEFDARDRVEFEAHLQACCTCRCAVERDAMFRDVVRRNLDGMRPDAIVRDRLHSRIACAHRSRVSRAVVVPIALAAGVTIALVGWRIMPHDAGGAGQPGDQAAIAGIPLARPAQRTAEVATVPPLDAGQLMARKIEAARLDALRREALHNGLRTVHVEQAAPQQEAIGG
jgi:anti-sigma factor RsiW